MKSPNRKQSFLRGVFIWAAVPPILLLLGFLIALLTRGEDNVTPIQYSLF